MSVNFHAVALNPQIVPLSKEVVKACKLTEEQYTAIYNALSPDEQGRLPHDVQRHAAVVLLANMQHPENRQRLFSNVVAVATLCTQLGDVHVLRKFSKVIPVEAGPYLAALNAVLIKTPPNGWVHIYEHIKKGGNDFFVTLALLLKSLKCIKTEELIELMDVVRDTCHTPAIANSVQLFSLCDESSHIPKILSLVANLPPDVQEPVITQVANSLQSSTDSRIVYELLQETAGLHLIARVMERIQIRQQDEETFFVDRNDLGICPHIVLSKFIQFIQAAPRSARSICFVGNDIRGPGIAKEFLSQLVTAVCKNLVGCSVLDDGRMRLENDKITPEENDIYYNLGKLFMFCIKQDLVIGMVLDPGIFCALPVLCQYHCDYPELLKDIDIAFPLYAPMRAHYPADIQAIDSMRLSLHLDETYDVLVEAMPKALIPCIAIWKAMEIPEDISAKELEMKIQGSIDANGILQNLQFHELITTENQAKIIAWIKALDDDQIKLKKFLTAVTGSPGLGSKSISVVMMGDAIGTATCGQVLVLPDIQIDEALKQLDDFLMEDLPKLVKRA